MTARWDELPAEVQSKVRRSRRAPSRGSYRCAGANGCGEILADVTYAFAERHADMHGGARIENVTDDEEGRDGKRS